VLVARDSAGIHGAAMGYATTHPPWPRPLSDEWDRFEVGIPGFAERMAVYDTIAARARPSEPHYYLGVIGVDPRRHGQGIGMKLLEAFCDISVGDPLSVGVYLETAEASNLAFYRRAGFKASGVGQMGGATLWCMYLQQAARRSETT
jgi:ribosomal protein S18 acetylase RimI-like enzyme